MDYRVLGSLEVGSDGHDAGLGPPKQRATLAILLLHAGEIVPTERLIEFLWGEHAPRTAAHSSTAFYAVLADHARGTLVPGERSFGLAEGGVGISYSGGFIDDLRPELEALKAAIISGEIEVPTVPIGAGETGLTSMR